MFRRLSFLPIIFLFFCLVINSASFDPPPEKESFTVAIIGDRTGGDPEGLVYLERAVYEINQLNPDFVIHIGDMVQGYTRDQEQWLLEYEEFMSYMDELNVPWYPVAGNHDVFTPIWDVEDMTYENLYKEYFGEVRYSFDYKNSHFVIMYTDDAMTSVPEISTEQMEWLKNDLEGTDKSNIFIFLHKPVWRYSGNKWDEVHQIIRQFPVKAVIAGHFHNYTKDVNKDGIQYYVVGPTGGEFFDSNHELYGYFHHYSILRIFVDNFSMAVVKLGNVEADDYVLADDTIRMRNLSIVSTDKTGIRGWLWQPKDSSVDEEVELYVHNPLDISIPVLISLNPDRGDWSMEPPILGFTLDGGADMNAKVVLSAPITPVEDIIPPEFEIEYRYTDTYGRKIPMIVRRRAFLRDTFELSQCDEPIILDALKTELCWQQVEPLYNHTWIYSVYERPDAPPKIYLTADDDNLYFYAEVMDHKYSYLKDNKSRGLLSDAIIFSALPNGERKDVVIFPFNEDGGAFLGNVDAKGIIRPVNMTSVSGVEYNSRTDEQAGYYFCEGKVPFTILFGEDDLAGKELLFNTGVIDNDKEAFIYVYTWAFDRDPQYWGVLNFTADK
jgi:predicted phosphodiesterase